MTDGPRRPPFTPSGDRPFRGGKGPGSGRRDDNRQGGDTPRDGSFRDNSSYRDRGAPRSGDQRGDSRDHTPSRGGGDLRENTGGRSGSSYYDRPRQSPYGAGGGAPRRDRPANSPQTSTRRSVHYQVVAMDDEEWGDTLEQRLNVLGHDGWRLVAIDEGRHYVFMHVD